MRLYYARPPLLAAQTSLLSRQLPGNGTPTGSARSALSTATAKSIFLTQTHSMIAEWSCYKPVVNNTIAKAE